jgi:hypothetical protein
VIELPDTSTVEGQHRATELLAELRGMDYRGGIFGGWFIGGERVSVTEDYDFNLYHPSCMPLAWGFVNWAARKSGFSTNILFNSFIVDGTEYSLAGLFQLPPEKAQRAWLDEVLSWAIEMAVER